jgi:hypothetical protein
MGKVSVGSGGCEEEEQQGDQTRDLLDKLSVCGGVGVSVCGGVGVSVRGGVGVSVWGGMGARARVVNWLV